MRIEIICSECKEALKYEVKKYREGQFDKFEVDYVVEPCSCTDNTDIPENPEYGHCPTCEDVPPLTEEISNLKQDLQVAKDHIESLEKSLF